MSPTKKVPKAKPKAVAKKPAPGKPAPEGRAAPKRAAEPAAPPRPKEKDARKGKPAPKATAAPARKPPARGAAGRGTAAGADPKARLGAKHLCFKCGAKFYDLNKPEPICPKCGTDQRNRPKVEPKAKTAAPAGQRRQVTRPMVPLLEDEEEDEVLVDEELDLEGVEESPEEFLDEEEEEPEEPPES
ncbi:MAG TPA: FYDLN acid domain-containing protein [Myxococcota bacterium]|jgi:uncharacterized protein (TIGR02300 family)